MIWLKVLSLTTLLVNIVKPFNCTKCGLCCQHVSHLGLPNVNGVCVNCEPFTRSCSIYQTRPLVCRIDEGYEAVFKNEMTKEDFYRINEEACRKLQELG